MLTQGAAKHLDLKGSQKSLNCAQRDHRQKCHKSNVLTSKFFPLHALGKGFQMTVHSPLTSQCLLSSIILWIN